MHGARNGYGSIVRFAMVVGIITALGMSGAAAATPERCSCGGGAVPPAMSAAGTAQALEAYWAMLDSGAWPETTVAEDAVLTLGDMGQQFEGRAAVMSAMNNLFHGAFAGRLTVDERIIGGGWAATSGTFVGTQIGSYDGMAATGHSVAVPYTAFYTVVDGQIDSIRLDFSQQDLLRQLAGTVIPWSSTQTRPGMAY